MASGAGAWQLQVVVLGEKELRERLDRKLRDLQDWSPALQRIAESFQAYMERVFASEGAEGGGAWVRLSPAYARWKAQHYSGRTILTRTGDLRKSLTTGAFRRQGKTSLEVGTQSALAALHQVGQGRMPARPIVRMNDALAAEWLGYLREQLDWEE